MAKQGLVLEHMTVGTTYYRFDFSFYDNNVRQAWYKFQSFQTDGIQTSKPWQDLNSSILKGPDSPNNIPVREHQALLMTVLQSPSTWSVETYQVRLILRGILEWEWEVTFEIGMFPFRLDGIWNQAG